MTTSVYTTLKEGQGFLEGDLSPCLKKNGGSMIRYQGIRDEDGNCEVWICSEQGVHGKLPLHLEIVSHSPDGFQWGYGGSGPRQLAVALLYHATGRKDVAECYSNDFKWAVVSKFHLNWWEMSKADILDCVRGLMSKFLREVPDLADILDADAIRIRHAEEPDPLEVGGDDF